MSEITFLITESEKTAVVKAIKALDNIPHLKYMSQSMIAVEANIKPTKIRAILTKLIEERRITQYVIRNSTINRYYYTAVTPAALQS